MENQIEETVMNETEWSGSCDPCDPANYWIDDETDERVNAATGQRTQHACPEAQS
jgi:hypothetical protein